MDHAVQWDYNIQTMQGRGSFPMLLWHYSFHRLSTKQMRAVRGVSTIISRGARSILQIQQYCRLCSMYYREYVSLLKIAGWRSIYSEWRTLTTSQNSGISTYSVFGRCAERYVLQVLYLTSQYLCTVIGIIYEADKQCCGSFAAEYNFRNIILKMGFLFMLSWLHA